MEGNLGNQLKLKETWRIAPTVGSMGTLWLNVARKKPSVGHKVGTDVSNNPNVKLTNAPTEASEQLWTEVRRKKKGRAVMLNDSPDPIQSVDTCANGQDTLFKSKGLSDMQDLENISEVGSIQKVELNNQPISHKQVISQQQEVEHELKTNNSTGVRIEEHNEVHVSVEHSRPIIGDNEVDDTLAVTALQKSQNQVVTDSGSMQQDEVVEMYEEHSSELHLSEENCSK
ncbi:unnamed protein product [Rhodiola kirilowii]